MVTVMGWFFASVLSVFLAGLGLRFRSFRRHWRQLESVIDELSQGREPKSFVFFGSSRFAKLGNQLEILADQQERLRRRRTRQEMNLQTILASMEEGVMVADLDHRIRLVNPALMRLFQVSFDPVGQSVLQILRAPDCDEIVSEALSSWQPQARELQIGGGKQPLHLSLNAMPMRNASGEEGVVTIFRDVTRLKQFEEMRREFVANVSHELRTPLSIFNGYLEHLRDNPELPRAQLVETVAVLERHSLRLNALVEDLLILARLESRDMVLQLEEIDVALFIREIAGYWKLHSARKNIGIFLDLEPSLPILYADALRLEQVLNNLVDNAIKYSPANREVRILASAVEGWLELRIEDQGVGITAADLPHIFERFYRADKARTREQGGTGLGLSIVKHIAQTHGGSVTAESIYGHGTKIILRLPLEPTAAPAPTV